MRVLIVGPASARERLRAELIARGIEVVGEAPTLAAARELRATADAVVSTWRAGSSDPADPLLESLTPRELDVLNLLALGLSNKAIAGRLGISDQTVKVHIASLSGKLGALNRTDAVRRAVRRGLIDL